MQKRRETAGKQQKEGIPPEVNSKRMPDSIRRNYQEREPASNAGQMDGEERKGKERKGKEQFGTEFVVILRDIIP